MVNIKELVRENVVKLTPYSCARDEFKGKEGIFMDANENPYGALNRYPDPYQTELKKAVSEVKGIALENIFIGNGSDEIIDLCFRVFCRPGIDKILTFTPTYGMYEVSASVNDIEVIRIPLNSSFQINLQKVKPLLSDRNLKLTFICSPNNPTGNCMNYADIEHIISTFRGIVVIDEAYIDFSDKPSFLKMVEKYPNLIVMQTFSKALGLASVRVGMAFTNPQIIQYFNKVKPPYNISTINQRAALNKLSKTEKVKKQVRRIKMEKAILREKLSEMSLTDKVFPSDSNFLLVKVKNADLVYNSLVKMNIITRNRNQVIKDCIRITVGKPSENKLLVNALKTIKI
ncbi:MAG: histidinol-phosphate transaminase [Bacteroidetes bacterium GWE2_41_25]|nr:MAG: histidinol-phosphate transaminase [Bacteroidetes bacterium GWA2_40_15]OFY13396.1 MAG: histidinol-phosphate transaminase [Bacteroidetes bacterium GWE2_41_25]HBQ81757.1 histidinol-phosphate transaminase [Bacteroidales bacterium]